MYIFIFTFTHTYTGSKYKAKMNRQSSYNEGKRSMQ